MGLPVVEPREIIEPPGAPPAVPPDAPPLARTRSEDARISADDEVLARRLSAEERSAQREREALVTFDCCICLDKKPVEGSFTAQCDHRVCSACLVDFVEEAQGAGSVSEQHLRCPDCAQPFAAEAIYDTLVRNGQRELAVRFADLRTEEGLAADGANFRRCPRTACNYTFAWHEGDALHFHCPECKHAFCLACTAGGEQGAEARVGPAHPGRTCAQRGEELRRDADERRRHDEWQALNSRADALFSDYVAQDQDTRACPGCSRVINRSSACDHMTCRWCRAEFCIVCGNQPQCGITCPRRR